MEAKDYRIGNWVECFGVRQIIAIEEKRIKLDKEKTSKGVTSSINFEWCPISSTSLNPIPLTEQVLIDCGFEKLKSDYEEAETWDFYYGILYFDMANNSVKINSQYCLSNIPEYLHQLQNLYFALTGQELEYKPKK